MPAISEETRPNPADAPVKALDNVDEELVPKAVVLLRLAKAMAHGTEGSITSVAADVNGERVSLKLRAKDSPDLEIWLLSKEKAYFREVFGRELTFEVS